MLLGDIIQGVQKLGEGSDLALVQQVVTDSLSIVALDKAVLGVGDGLLDRILSGALLNNALDSLDDGTASESDGWGRAGEGDGEEASVGVLVVGGADVHVAGGILLDGREHGSTVRPLNIARSTEKLSEDGEGGVVAESTESARARESDCEGIARGAGDTDITTEVTSLDMGLRSEGTTLGRGAQVREELVDPFAQVGGVVAGADDGEARLDVEVLSEGRDGLGRHVLLPGGGQGGDGVVAETVVEGGGVGGV